MSLGRAGGPRVIPKTDILSFEDSKRHDYASALNTKDAVSGNQWRLSGVPSSIEQSTHGVLRVARIWEFHRSIVPPMEARTFKDGRYRFAHKSRSPLSHLPTCELSSRRPFALLR